MTPRKRLAHYIVDLERPIRCRLSRFGRVRAWSRNHSRLGYVIGFAAYGKGLVIECLRIRWDGRKEIVPYVSVDIEILDQPAPSDHPAFKRLLNQQAEFNVKH